MAKGFQCKIGVKHVADTSFVYFKFIFLTYGMSAKHNISKNGMYALFSNKKEENMHSVIYK